MYFPAVQKREFITHCHIITHDNFSMITQYNLFLASSFASPEMNFSAPTPEDTRFNCRRTDSSHVVNLESSEYSLSCHR